MGLRQSKRSVDISGSPKKEAPAAVVEKIPQTNDAPNQTIENIEEEVKTPINGEAKTTEPADLVNKKTKLIFHWLLPICFLIGQEHSRGRQG